MTDKELKKLRASLPAWDKQNKEEKKLDRELDCREMINSILIYGYLDNTIDEIYEDEYLRNYKKDISEERIKELIKEQQEDLKKSKINTDVYTDGEGVTYNSVEWYDEDEIEKHEESKQLNESLDSRYEVWQKYFEDEEPAKAEYVQSFNNYEEASKFAEGLNKDPNCDAWVVDKSKNESKEIDEEQIAKLYDYKEEDPEVNYDINPDDYNLKLAFDYEGDAETGPISDPVGPHLVGKLKDIYKYLDACGISRDDEDIEIYIEPTEELDESKEIANYSIDSLKNIVDLFNSFIRANEGKRVHSYDFEEQFEKILNANAYNLTRRNAFKKSYIL